MDGKPSQKSKRFLPRLYFEKREKGSRNLKNRIRKEKVIYGGKKDRESENKREKARREHNLSRERVSRCYWDDLRG